MAGPIEQLAVLGPRAPHPRSVERSSIVARPRAAAVQVVGMIVLSIAAILAAMPSALGVIIGFDLLIPGQLGIGWTG